MWAIPRQLFVVHRTCARSSANPSELPSRGALAELLELFESLGVRKATEVACRLPPFGSWDAPAREWIDEARGRGTKRVRGGVQSRLTGDGRSAAGGGSASR